MKIAWFLLHPNISYYCNCSYRYEPYAIIQSTYVVVITEGFHLRESADEKVNNHEGESATRSILLQPLYKEPKNVDVNLEFKLYNLENAAIRVHAFYNYPWRIPLIFYSLASTLTLLLLHIFCYVILLNSIISYIFGRDPRLSTFSVIPAY